MGWLKGGQVLSGPSMTAPRYMGGRFRRSTKSYKISRPISVSKYGRPRISNSFRRKVNAVINSAAEKKYHDVQATTSTDTSGSVTDLTAITQGDTDTTRDGDSVYIKSLQIRGYVVGADSYNVCRVIIFQWLMDTAVSGAAPTVSNILQSIAGGYGPVTPFTHDNNTQYRILYDKVFTPDTDDPVKPFNAIITKFARRKIQYTAGGTGGANKLYILLISDSGAASHPGVTYNTRVNFLDM